MLKNKKITIFTILIMVFNFIVPNAMMIVNAESTNNVQNKITSIETRITEVETLIEEREENSLYQSDTSYKVVTDYFKKSFIYDKNNFTTIKTNLESGLKLSELISYVSDTDTFDLYDEYLEWGNDPDKLISIIDLEDVTFTVPSPTEDPDEVKTLLTKSTLENIFINNYLKDIETKIDSYNLTRLENLKTSYDTIISEIDNEITNLNTYINLVKEYEEKELLDGNNPDMLVNNTNIYTLYEEKELLLEELKNKVDLSNTDEINNELLTIKDSIEDIYNQFTLNNSDFTLLNNEISELENKYNENINLLNDYDTEKELGSFDDINDKFITITNKFKELNDEYDKLIEKINKYLLRRPSDTSLADNELTLLNGYVSTYDYKATLEQLATEVDTEEDIDILLKSTLLSKETLKTLKTKKLECYEIKLIDDSNYKMILNENRMIIDIVKQLDIDNLLGNISFTGNSFSLTKENDIYYITFYDKNDNELIKYEVCLKNDLNNDYKLDNEDIKLLKELLLNEENDLLLTDFNNDELLNIKDVTDLDNFINSIYSSTDGSSKFSIKKEEKDNIITYEVYLNTDNIASGFSFDINVSDDLTFKEYTSDYDLILDNINNPTKVIGTGTFKEGTLLVKLVYELDTSSTKTTFNLNNGIIVNNNGLLDVDLSNLDIISRIKEEAKEVSSNTSSEAVITLEKIDEEETTEKEEVKPSVKIDASDMEDEEEKISISNVIKVILVILLGVLLIYFLNKTEEKEEDKEFLKDDKKEVK